MSVRVCYQILRLKQFNNKVCIGFGTEFCFWRIVELKDLFKNKIRLAKFVF